MVIPGSWSFARESSEKHHAPNKHVTVNYVIPYRTEAGDSVTFYEMNRSLSTILRQHIRLVRITTCEVFNHKVDNVCSVRAMNRGLYGKAISLFARVKQLKEIADA